MKVLATISGTSLAALLAAAAMTVAPVQNAHAQQADGAGMANVRLAAKGGNRDEGAQFDWLAKRNPHADANTRILGAASGGRHGSGSWICSPAGFGKRSSCYNR